MRIQEGEGTLGRGDSYSPGHNAFFLLERWIYVKDFFYLFELLALKAFLTD